MVDQSANILQALPVLYQLRLPFTLFYLSKIANPPRNTLGDSPFSVGNMPIVTSIECTCSLT